MFLPDIGIYLVGDPEIAEWRVQRKSWHTQNRCYLLNAESYIYYNSLA